MLCRRNDFLAVAIGSVLGLAAQAQETSGIGLEEIVVTAQKVQEDVQKIPISIATIRGEDLQAAGVFDASQLNRYVPGVNIQNNGPGAVALFIRGVGGTIQNAFGDPGNAFSVDQVFFSRPVGPDVVFFDVERVEVLKGPQGTLYGRNATGGAFNLITRKPDEEFGGQVSLDVGNYEHHRVEAALNVPVSDAFKMRFAGQKLQHEGYFDDGYGDVDTYAGRVHMLLEPSNTWSVLLTGDYAHQGGRGPGYVPHGPDPQFTPFPQPIDPSRPSAGTNQSGRMASEWIGNEPWLGPCSAQVRAYIQSQVSAVPNSPVRDNGAECDGYADNEIYGAALDLEIDVGFAGWSTIASWRETDIDVYRYIAPDGQVQRTDAEQVTFETRLASSDEGLVKWIGGLFYLKEDQVFSAAIDGFPPGPALPIPGPQPLQSSLTLDWPDITNESWAAFGQATISLADSFRLIAGVRYTEEEKSSFDTRQQNYQWANPSRTSNDLTQIPLGAPLVTDSELKFDSTTYRGGVEWDIAQDALLYGTVSTGFHAGGLIPGAPTGPAGDNTYDSEELTAYALGLKSRFLDQRVQLNVEVFHWEYEDLQVQGVGPINTGLPAPAPQTATGLRTDNAGEATIQGVDADVQLLVTDNGLFTLGLLYSDSEYDRFVIPPVNPALPAIVVSGYRIASAPEWSGTVGYQHTFELGSAGSIVAAVHSSIVSGHWRNPIHYPGAYQEGYSTSDATLGYVASSGSWSITAYVRNIEDDAVLLTAQNEQPVYNSPMVALMPPRTYGVLFHLDF